MPREGSRLHSTVIYRRGASATYSSHCSVSQWVGGFIVLNRHANTDRDWAVLHLLQAVRYRAWWLLPTAVLAALGETLGWSGRLWSSYSPLNQTPFFIQ